MCESSVYVHQRCLYCVCHSSRKCSGFAFECYRIYQSELHFSGQIKNKRKLYFGQLVYLTSQDLLCDLHCE